MKKILLLLASGCSSRPTKEDAAQYAVWPHGGSLSAYMTAVTEQADAITASLEQDLLTQTDMNIKAQELSALWDRALYDLWTEVQRVTPKGELDRLNAEQTAWMTEKETAVHEAGKEFEGGSLYPLIVSSEAARLTRARAEALYELLKAAGME